MTQSLTLSWFFTIARLEGLSFLALLGIAMPLKYLADLPSATLWVGWMHGFLFLLYLIALGSARRTEGWPILRWLWGFIASLVPGGTFVFEAFVRRSAARREEPA